MRSANYKCQSLLTALDDERLPQSMAMSPSGRVLIIQHRDAQLLAAVREDGWRMRPLSPIQLRPVTPPYALSKDETLIAVPAGETGLRIIDLSDGSILAELPTVSRVLKIAFVNSDSNLVTSLDANVLRIWDWRVETLLKQVCDRWNPEAQVFNASDIAAALPREVICGPQ